MFRWLLGALLLLLTGCGGPQPGADASPDVTSDRAINQLLSALQQRGITPQAEGPSNVEWLNSAPGRSYRLSSGRLFIHAYPSAEAAQKVAAQIPPTADTGATDWADTPHFFRCEHVIALYLGKAPAIISGLTAQCGAQFAGQ